ncbi:hypothetical protein, partial [Burkholderia sp. SIMBA_019]|uniref:hypothetical protein n=1 Tax=Burkholderia sp. SIMBA_019 TaxID=3085765 RepID=UPI00397AD987
RLPRRFVENLAARDQIVERRGVSRRRAGTLRRPQIQQADAQAQRCVVDGAQGAVILIDDIEDRAIEFRIGIVEIEPPSNSPV